MPHVCQFHHTGICSREKISHGQTEEVHRRNRRVRTTFQSRKALKTKDLSVPWYCRPHRILSLSRLPFRHTGMEKACIRVRWLQARLAPQAGLEPATLRLTAECSAIELLRNITARLLYCSDAWLSSKNPRFCVFQYPSPRRFSKLTRMHSKGSTPLQSSCSTWANSTPCAAQAAKKPR